MSERSPVGAASLILDQDQPLIGLMLEENGQDVVRYFANDEDADYALADDVPRRALDASPSEM